MTRYRGKHRKPSRTRHAIARLATVGAAIMTPVMLAHPAGAAGKDWDALAQCESGGNWEANTGNGFEGGLQFTPSTWAAYGGTQYAHNAADATREQQIAVAQRVLNAQGPGAWPVCSKKTGFSGGGSGDTSGGDTSSGNNGNASQGNTPTPSQAPNQNTGNQPAPAGEDDYTVQPGDTLTGIADQFRIDWHTIYQRNATILHNPNLIFPGEQLTLQ
jgi:hypothetical protein